MGAVGAICGDLAQRRTQRLVIARARRLAALGRAVLAHDPTRPALADAQTVAQHRDRPAPTGWAHQFPRDTSFSATFLQLLVGHDPLQGRVPTLQLFEALDVVGLHPAVLVAPSMIRRLGDTQVPRDLRERLALAQQPEGVGLSQAPDRTQRATPVDGHPAHRVRIARDFVVAHPELIELHFLPGYAPELNPAEMLNGDVKANALGRQRPVNVTQLKADVWRCLTARLRRPWQVAKYFRERHVTYPAA